MTSPTDKSVELICAALGYQLEAEVGSGSFKVTYRVRDPDGSPWALKVFNQTEPDDRSAREIEAMAMCDDDTIAKLKSVDVFDTGTSRHLFMVEEYLAGGSLANRLQSGPLAREATLEVGTRLIHALCHLAPRRLVHRDIKPDNVMFRTEQFDAVLVDFGIVRNLTAESLTASWAVMGPATPLFAAPEQLQNAKAMIGPATDQFSLGVTLALASSGQHPFIAVGEGPNDAIRRVHANGPLPRTSVETLMSLGLPVLIKMMSPWPIHRYRRPEDLLSSWKAQ
ncbi:MAG: serine/threonine protein kinase [Dehalococcoidia bacterium]|nr:serine/threonine protein kinase [Dehalococcoidia bacterium]